MGFGKMLKQFFNDEALGDQTVETIEAVFLKAQRQQPHEEPHAWLASTWLNRIKAKGQNIDHPDIRMMAFTETYLHACVKPPLCARSLGLYFLYKENLNIIEKYPKFAVEYASLIGPVLKAQEEGTIDQLYRRYNAVMAQDIDNEGIDGSHKVVSWSGRIEPLDIMTALQPTRDGISWHDEDKTGKGQRVSELNTSLFPKDKSHQSEPNDTASSKLKLSDTIAKIRK